MVGNRFGTGKKRARILRWLIPLSVTAVLALIVWSVWFSSWLAVSKVDVTGNSSLKSSRVISTADVDHGQPLARIDTEGIKARISKLSRVEQVEVSRGWPHSVRIKVTERTAVAWAKIDGTVQAIDRHGVAFRELDKTPKGLVKISVPNGSERDSRESLRACAKVVHSLRKHDSDFVEKVKSITATSRDSVEFDIGKNRNVRWGSAEEALEKLRVLRTLLDEVDAQHYDVSSPSRPATEK